MGICKPVPFGQRVAACQHIVHCKIESFSEVSHGFLLSFALPDDPGKRRRSRYIAPIFRIEHDDNLKWYLRHDGRPLTLAALVFIIHNASYWRHCTLGLYLQSSSPRPSSCP